MAKLKFYKIKFDGANGTGLYFVCKALNKEEAKKIFYAEMLGTDRIKAGPSPTTKGFVGNVKMRNYSHWVIKP